MSEYKAQIVWERGPHIFTDNRYSRAHKWRFDGEIEIPASSSPSVVPLPFSITNAVDPEEAFVASISSCHMLWFLSISAKQNFCVDSYHDDAVGLMEKDSKDNFSMTQVILYPKAIFSGELVPTQEELVLMHHKAHEKCFIANSVKTNIQCIPIYD